MPRRKRTGGTVDEMASNFGGKISEEYANDPKGKEKKQKNKKKQ